MKFIEQTWDIFADSFPFTFPRNDFGGGEPWWDGTREGAISEMRASSQFFNLPFGPIMSVTHINGVDQYGTIDTIDLATYTVDTKSNQGRIALNNGVSWPLTVLASTNGVNIRAIFGFGPTANDVPDDIKQAILHFVAKVYEHRGDEEIPSMPSIALLMVEPYRRIKV